MTRIPLSIQPRSIAVAIALSLMSVITAIGRVQSQTDSSNPSQRRIQFIAPPAAEEPNPFDGDERPVSREPSTGRDDCPAVTPPLTALIPNTSLVLTVAERPSFWFYIPYGNNNSFSGEFVFQNPRGEDLYRIPFILPESPSIVKLTPPVTSPRTLEIGQDYHWFVKVYCNSQNSEYVFVEGWVRRVRPTAALESELALQESSQYLAYAANGIWYDALTDVGNLLVQNSTPDLQQVWLDLLQAAGLEHLSEKSVVDCCSLEN